MLVLTRKVNESIIINGNISVILLEIEGDKVKLGIAAPREVTILRKELHDSIQAQEKLQARLVEGSNPESFNHLIDLTNSQPSSEDPPPSEDKPKK